MFRRTFTRKFISESGIKKTRAAAEVRLNWEVKTVERILKDDDIEGGYVIKVTGTRNGKHQTLYGKKVVVVTFADIQTTEDDDDGCDDDDKKGKKKIKKLFERVPSAIGKRNERLWRWRKWATP